MVLPEWSCCMLDDSETAAAVCSQEYVLWWALDGETGTEFRQVAELCSDATWDVFWCQKTKRSVLIHDKPVSGIFRVGAVVQSVEYRTRNREVAGSTHTRSTAINLEQVANLLCAQANSASYPQQDGKWVVATATGWRPSVADWGDAAMVCLLAAPWVQLSVSVGSGWPMAT